MSTKTAERGGKAWRHEIEGRLAGLEEAKTNDDASSSDTAPVAEIPIYEKPIVNIDITAVDDDEKSRNFRSTGWISFTSEP